LLLLAAVLAAVLWAIAQVLGWPVWARAVLAGLAAVTAVIIPELRARFEQDDTRTRQVEQLVAVSGGSRHLPLIRTVGLDQLGVHAARVQVPYIKRDQQDELEKSVGPGKAVLVVGHSMSGKTRLVAHVVKRKFPDAPLVAVETGNALKELFNGGLDPAGTVVWLDDLERFLGADGLTVNLLNRLTTGRAIVVATIRTEKRDSYRPQKKLRPLEWEVLQRFNKISLQRRLTGPELSRVRTTVNDPGILDAVDHYGLAEYLGAGPESLDKFEAGEIVNPLGQALVRAAIDWRRTGLTRPVSQHVLATMLPTYLADRPDVPRTEQTIDEGLAWATMEINETVALLGRVFTGSNGPVFNAFDYLVDQLERTKEPIPNQMLSVALEQAESDELTVIGNTAYLAGNLAIAGTAWRRASDSNNYPFASLNLGLLLEQQGDVEGAKAAYQKAIKSRDLGPMVALNLVGLLVEEGDLEGAKVAYQTGNLATAETAWGRTSDGVSLSSFNLGVLLDQQADLEGAKVAYQEAIDNGNADQAPMAALRLGWLLEEQGDLEGAKVAYQRAIDSGHANTVPLAALSLRKLLMDQEI
jgi:tetratricopeptide (TPR) repeat protein